MPVVRNTRNVDDGFHHFQDAGEKSATPRTPTDAGVRHPRQAGQSSTRRRDHTSNNTQGGSTGRPTSSRSRPSPRRPKRQLAREGGGEDYTNKLKAAHHDTPSDNVDDGRPQPTQPGDTYPTEHSSNIGSFADEAYLNTIPAPGSQERFDDDVMIYYHSIEPSLASQFLNLDDQPSACVDQMTVAGTQSTATSSSALADIPTGLEPSSFHLFDMNKFETVTDIDGGNKTVPWPWGDYQYRASTPPGYIDTDEYAEECRFSEIGKLLQEELSDVMVREAIFNGEQEAARRKQGEKREGKKAVKGNRKPGTVAFNNQVVHGRTIYDY